MVPAPTEEDASTSFDASTSTPIEDAPGWVWRVNEFVALNQACRDHAWFNALVVICIVVAGILVGVQSYPSMDGSASIALLDVTVQWVFTVECLVKIVAEGTRPWKYWCGKERGWNNFDFWLVFICWLPFDGGNVAFLRLLRLMRLLKLVGKVKQLQVIVMGLIKGLSSVSYIMLLMLLIFYLFAVLGVGTFRKNDPFHFGSIGIAMVTLFRCATLEDWTDVLYTNMYGCDTQYGGPYGVYYGIDGGDPAIDGLGSANAGFSTLFGYFPTNECWHPIAQPFISTVFFIFFTLIAAFVLLSLFVGAVCGGMGDAMEQFKEQEETEKKEREKREAAQAAQESGAAGSAGHTLAALREAFDACDLDGGGEIDAEELSLAMKAMGESISVEHCESIIADLDKDGDGTLGFAEFVNLMTGGEVDANVEIKPPGLEKTASEEMMRSQARQENAECMALIASINKAWRGERHTVHGGTSDGIQQSNLMTKYLEVADKAHWLSAQPWFVNTITVTIVAAGITVGIQTELAVPGETVNTPALDLVDDIILAIFTIEVVVKLVAEGNRPWHYFTDAWNIFDFVIVFACFVFMLPFMPDVSSMLAMLRLLRLLRVLKLVRALPQLRIIIEALISGFGSISFVTIILFMFFYLFANVGMIAFAENDPMHFGNLQTALLSLFRAATMDDWTDIMYINMFGCDRWGYELGRKYDTMAKSESIVNCNNPKALGWVAALFMICFEVLGALVLLTLFIGIVATAMEEAKQDQKEEKEQEKKMLKRAGALGIDSRVGIEQYRHIFDSLDKKKQGMLDKQAMKPLVRSLPLIAAARMSKKLSRNLDIKVGMVTETPVIEITSRSPPLPEPEAAHDSAPAKSLTKGDLDKLLSIVDDNFNGSVEFTEFLTIMDFMRRVDEDPAVLEDFRRACESIKEGEPPKPKASSSAASPSKAPDSPARSPKSSFDATFHARGSFDGTKSNKLNRGFATTAQSKEVQDLDQRCAAVREQVYCQALELIRLADGVMQPAESSSTPEEKEEFEITAKKLALQHELAGLESISTELHALAESHRAERVRPALPRRFSQRERTEARKRSDGTDVPSNNSSYASDVAAGGEPTPRSPRLNDRAWGSRKVHPGAQDALEDDIEDIKI